MADKFRGFWVMEAGERDEKYLLPATPEEVATQLRKMGYRVVPPALMLPVIVFKPDSHEEFRTKVPRMPEQKHHIKNYRVAEYISAYMKVTKKMIDESAKAGG